MKIILRLYFMTKEITTKLNQDKVSAYSAMTSFFIIVSLFPFLILLFTILQYLPIEDSFIINTLVSFLPSQIHELIMTTIENAYLAKTNAIISISAIATLWVSGKAFLGITDGLNSIYGTNETRNYIIRRIKSSIYTLFFLLIIVFTLLFLVFGKHILNTTKDTFPIFYVILTSLLEYRFIIGQCILTLFFMFMYKYIPNRKISLIKELPGALISAIGWQAFSLLYSVYVNHSLGFSVMYGSLTTIVFAMLWLYFCIYILFFGAEFNTFLEHKIIWLPWKKEK